MVMQLNGIMKRHESPLRVPYSWVVLQIPARLGSFTVIQISTMQKDECTHTYNSCRDIIIVCKYVSGNAVNCIRDIFMTLIWSREKSKKSDTRANAIFGCITM